MQKIRHIVFSPDAPPVVHTVVERLAVVTGAERQSSTRSDDQAGIFRVSVGDEDVLLTNPGIHFRVDETGSGFLRASEPHWLFAGQMLIEDEWGKWRLDKVSGGLHTVPAFSRMRNLSDFFVGSLRHARGFDKEDYVKQVARQGFSHITVNGLGADRPFESGPPGDVYSWFYDYSPDIDQFVDSFLLRGYYPPDYLHSNLNTLRKNVALARKYGLTPGLHINSPRSMPEEFWRRFPYLRGARVDHPRETFLPRYTLAMAHPVVQAHYRELVQKIMVEVPELGFIHLWTNDSGAGFEFVSSLYAGRNGGPYLIREWKDDDEIARKAASNVLTYYRLITDEAKKVNPDFHLVCDLGPFYVERKYIVPELGNGIDAGEFGYFESKETEREQETLEKVGAATHVKLEASDTNVIGVPYPWLVYERLTDARRRGTQAILLGANPESLAPFDVNNEVIRSVQLSVKDSVREIIEGAASRFVDDSHREALIDAWKLSDSAVRAFPAGVPMSTFGFPWFRLWVRPFVPNIDAIPEADRTYYEPFLLATFNNPARVDLNNDMMWNFLSVEQAAQKKSAFDQGVLPPLTKAIDNCRIVLGGTSAPAREKQVFKDLHDRLTAYRCFCRTMRNTVAWTEAIHGYLQSTTEEERKRHMILTKEMIENEIGNTKSLLQVWNEGLTEVIPVSRVGETLHIYGDNFGELLERKIALMERHKSDTPYIDPNYMWRMPPVFSHN